MVGKASSLSRPASEGDAGASLSPPRGLTRRDAGEGGGGLPMEGDKPPIHRSPLHVLLPEGDSPQNRWSGPPLVALAIPWSPMQG